MTFDATGLLEKRNRRGTRYFEKGDGKIVAKECVQCREVKRVDEFSKKARGFKGINPNCRKCANKTYNEYVKKDPQKYLEIGRKSSKKYRERNVEERRAYNREYYDKNKSRIIARTVRYFENNPHKRIENTNKRRARKRVLPVEDIKINPICALTNKRDDLHIDHVIPLSIGRGGHTEANVIYLSDYLNISKSDRNIFDWFADNRERFGLEQRKFDGLIEYLAEINGMTTKEYEEYVRWCHDNPRTIDEINAEEDDDGASA